MRQAVGARGIGRGKRQYSRAYPVPRRKPQRDAWRVHAVALRYGVGDGPQSGSSMPQPDGAVQMTVEPDPSGFIVASPSLCLGRLRWTSSGGRTRSCQSIERNPTVAQRDVGVVADHEVVQHVDVEEAAGRECLGGEVQVVR